MARVFSENYNSAIDFIDAESRFEKGLGDELGNYYLPGELAFSQHLARIWTQYRSDDARFNNAAGGRADLYALRMAERFSALLSPPPHKSPQKARPAQVVIDFNSSLPVFDELPFSI